jgi:hemerythrin-like domain-containing protein
MKLTDMLRIEHDLIEQALDVLRAVADAATESSAASTAAGRTLVEFFVQFADGVHHDKEERALFPAMYAQGFPSEGGPIPCMLSEHDEGRRLVAELRAALDVGIDGREGLERFRAAARDFAILLGQHIFKENRILFEMAERAVPDEVQLELGATHEAAHREAMDRFGPPIAELARAFVGKASAGGAVTPAGPRP